MDWLSGMLRLEPVGVMEMLTVTRRLSSMSTSGIVRGPISRLSIACWTIAKLAMQKEKTRPCRGVVEWWLGWLGLRGWKGWRGRLGWLAARFGVGAAGEWVKEVVCSTTNLAR